MSSEMRSDFVITAPGRACLMGQHTDYNGLPVMPVAIERCIAIRGGKRTDRIVSARTQEDRDGVQFSLDTPIEKHPQGHWANYVKAGIRGVLGDLEPEEADGLLGCDLDISGNIPQGVGLSSSSALVVASAMAILQANGREFDRLSLAERMADAEYFVGTCGGGMDQATCLMGQAGHLLKIDFFPLRVAEIPFPDSASIVICDSGIDAKKSEGAMMAYNMRAVECRFASFILNHFCKTKGFAGRINRVGDFLKPPLNYSYEDLATLAGVVLEETYTFSDLCAMMDRDAFVTALLEDYGFIDESEYEGMVLACGRRYRHVIHSGWRVEKSQNALENGDVAQFGALMDEGHVSERDIYEISCPELNHLVEAAKDAGALGARISGAGFGGCTVNLVPKELTVRFTESMLGAYSPSQRADAERTGRELVFVTSPAEGAQITLMH